MRAIVQDVPEAWIEERTRRGLDLFDEMWEGVLHLVPPPGFTHQKIATKILAFLEPRLAARGIEVLHEAGVFRPGAGGKDYRVPDLVFFPADRPDLVSERGVEGAPLAVLESRSPDDETYEKFDFWARLGVPEVIVVLPDTRAAEVYRLTGTRYLATSGDDAGRVHAASIDVRLWTVPGEKPRLRVEHAGEAREV